MQTLGVPIEVDPYTRWEVTRFRLDPANPIPQGTIEVRILTSTGRGKKLVYTLDVFDAVDDTVPGFSRGMTEVLVRDDNGESLERKLRKEKRRLSGVFTALLAAYESETSMPARLAAVESKVAELGLVMRQPNNTVRGDRP